VKISLIDVDSKIPNLPLMKLSTWHKAQGDEVDIYSPVWSKPDKVYVSKVFNYTSDFNYFPDGVEIVKGGSGYDLKSELPDEIENAYPDYQIFDCDYAMGFTTRGCIRNCPFCIVRRKEGKIKSVADIYNFWGGAAKNTFIR
jgi:radical SAM superfamily enzyme YgiQ (UPF0313 family)